MKMKKHWNFLVIFWVLWIAVVYPSVEQEDTSYCYNSYTKDILNPREIQGKWMSNEFHTNPGVFPFQKDFKEWWDQACPVQSRVFTCRRKDENETFGHGYDAFSQKFVLSNCKLREFEPLKFLSMIQNRRLGIAGDSVAMQFTIMIVCSLHGVTPNIEYQLSWHDFAAVYGRDVCVPGGEHCHLDESTIYYPAYNATIMLLPEFYLVNRKEFRRFTVKEYIDLGALHSPQDILLLNIGLHTHQQEDYYHLISTIAEEYTHMDPATRPIFIWRETSPQHFSSGGAGYYTAEGEFKSQPCIPYPNQEDAFLEDFRNRLASIWFKRFHIPVMSIANATGLAADQHIGQQETHNRFDCTHFCENSGVYYHWREVFFNLLPIVTAAWESGEATWQPPTPTAKKKFSIAENEPATNE